MKILHVVSSYWPAFEFGGPIQSVHLLNKYLVKNNIDITVYTTNAGLRKKNIPLKKEVVTDRVKIFYFPYYGYVHYTFSPALFFALKKNVKNFDIIHITGVWNFPVSVAAFWARWYRKPYCISPRGSLMKEPLALRKTLLKKILLARIVRRDFESADIVHFTADAEEKEYLQTGLTFRKSVIIPNGFEPTVFKNAHDQKSFRKKWGITENQKIILFLGRLNWKKGFDTLIPSFARIIQKIPSALLVIAGGTDENYKKTINQLIKKYNVHTSVVFTGMLTGEDKVAAFQESDVFALPTYSENFGMAVVEAMYYKLPIIITEKVGISQLIMQYNAGIVIKKNEQELTNALIKILTRAYDTTEMISRGKHLVETEFNCQNVAKRHIETYNMLLENR
ncbi:MAG: glycosyltransferase [Parcubacteria group bacterium]|nr:glycosyltransferase [Parcubacteria group bacterium]